MQIPIELSMEQERKMHYILDEGISGLKQSHSTNKSFESNDASEKSFTLRNALRQELESKSNSRERRPLSKDTYSSKQQQPRIRLMNPNESSLKMFLEELKSEDESYRNHHTTQESRTFYQGHRNNSNNYPRQHHHPLSGTSSLQSSANVEMVKQQEESFMKMQTEISQLKNKIRGLETQLGPSSSNNKRHGQSVMEEQRVRQHTNSVSLMNKMSQVENKENVNYLITSESEPQVQPSFPLRLKKNYSKQQQVEQKQQQKLNSSSEEEQESSRERMNPKIKQRSKEQSTRNVQLPRSASSQSDTLHSLKSSEKSESSPIVLKNKRIKEKFHESMIRPKSLKHKQQKEVQKSKELTQRSLNASLKRQSTYDQEREKNKSLRRLSEARKDRDNIQKELLEQRRENAMLKNELEKMKRKQEVRDEYMVKFRDLKLDYKQLLDSFENSESIRREQKNIISEQKKQMHKAKKKIKFYKEQLKKVVAELEKSEKALRNGRQIVKSQKHLGESRLKKSERPSSQASARKKSKHRLY